MIGTHLIKSWSRAQHVISLSSAEAELYAAVRAATEIMGVAALMEDMRRATKLTLAVDATATIGMLSREGLGRAKHVDIQYLWLQEKVKTQKLQLSKVPSLENPADMFTKPLTERENVGHLARMGIEARYADKYCRGGSAGWGHHSTEGECKTMSS